MAARKPIVAGQFYPGSENDCRAELQDYISNRPIEGKLPEKIVAGIVPHAGWVFSGDLAGMVFNAVLKVNQTIDTFIVFGATHSHIGATAAIYDKGSWLTPMGEIIIDEELASEILTKTKNAKSNPTAHNYEHSIEVQVPFIQYLFPNAKIVPIMTSPAEYALELGTEIGECIKKYNGKKIVCIGSTDLTHYGPRYGFAPKGVGAKGIDWAKNINDQNFIDLAIKMNAKQLLIESLENQNACGPGATAAVINAAKTLGKTKGVLLAHTHSNEVMKRKYHQTSDESVGYTAIIY
jgi:AmmeMemoRadiSam system protein B